MSVLKKIGIEEFLNHLGLTEAQVKIIYTNELDKLQKQETVLLESIKKASSKTEEQYKERQKLSQAMDGERLEIEAGKKAILATKHEIDDGRAALEREKRDVSALHVRLDENKGNFRQERIAFAERVKNLDAHEKAFNVKLSEFDDKDRALDNLKDELYLKKAELDQDLKDAKELKAKITAEKNELLALKVALDGEKRTITERKEELSKRETVIQTLTLDAKDTITKDKEAFYQEKRNTEESLRKREIEVAKKEKFAEENLASSKRKLEDAVIEEGRKKKP